MKPTDNQQNTDEVELTGVYDKNGNLLKNVYVKIPKQESNTFDASLINAAQPDTQSQTNNNKGNRHLFLGAITGALGSMGGDLGGLANSAGSALGLGDNAGGGLALGAGAAAAGAVARAARQEQHYFDVTKVQLQTNLVEFQGAFNENEYTELRKINIVASRTIGMLSSLEKGVTYRINSRMVEMIDMAS